MERTLSTRLSSAAILVLALGTACGGATTKAAPVASVSVNVPSPLGVGQFTQASAVLRDASQNVLSGRIVTWSSSAPGVATVSDSGVVTAVAVGSADITATSEGISRSASMSVLPLGALPTQMAGVSAPSQTGAPSSPVTQAPAVLVRDASGNPVEGVTVTFTVTAGAGSVTGSPAVTDARGVARSGAWTLGPAGSQSVRAASPAIPGVTVDFAGLSRAATAGFDITLRLLTPMTDSQVRAFVDAKERIEEIVVGDIPAQNVRLTAGELSSCGSVDVTETVDDVLILAEIVPIDGPLQTLGLAGPCASRPLGSGYFPVLGHMKFDIADMDRLEQNGTLGTVILHEMMHVIGFGVGTPWDRLLVGAGTSDPYFTGAVARGDLATLNNGAVYTGTPVPVESTGGDGTRDSHWRESVFDHELMTGFIDSGRIPFSATTVGALQDLGYAVDLSKADPFDLARPAALRASGLATVEPPVLLGRDVRSKPPFYLGPDGGRIGP